ncbi:unnamed protein product [Phyllotreta striolata]|uniref:EB domain-containing protein n=1 Tax=Phyllotreta striolata TaxID=444603 RepID=A0A9N9TTA8_PHYSR|nr:unnamed protein product [Phyllotreta striolata]
MMFRETISFVLLIFAVNGQQRKCNFADLDKDVDCGKNEVCEESGWCNCLPDFQKKDNECVSVASEDIKSSNYLNLVNNQGSGSIVAGILIPLFLIVFVMCGVYVTRKYHLLSWFRNRFRRRHENYDEFMIGQDEDDEPLS